MKEGWSLAMNGGVGGAFLLVWSSWGVNLRSSPFDGLAWPACAVCAKLYGRHSKLTTKASVPSMRMMSLDMAL